MARPTSFDRQTSFTQFSSQFPSKQQNGASLDAEFNAVKIAVDETQANLALIQDDDGRLARGSVGRAQFDSSVSLGFENPEPWTPDTSYAADLSTVFREAKFYTCAETHISGSTFDVSKWTLIADLSASAAIDPGSITEDKLAPNAATADKIGPLAVTTPKIASQAVTNSKLAPGAVTRSKVDDTAGPDLAALILPAGMGPVPWPFQGDAPTGWVLDDATYLRADYPALWARVEHELGLPNSSQFFTAGDGSTTFGVKRLAGLTPVGIDPTGVYVPELTQLGAEVGASDVALTQAELPAVSPTFNGTEDTVTVTTTRSDLVFGTVAVDQGGSGGSVGVILPATRENNSASSTGLFKPSGTISNLGSGDAHQNMQPSVAVRFMFKAH